MGLKQKILKTGVDLVQNLGGFPIKGLYSGIGHILMFHSIRPCTGEERVCNNYLEVTPEQLERIIFFYKENNYALVSLDIFYSNLSKRDYSQKMVVFTLDDGYEDNLTYGLPVFQKHNVPFTIYIATDFPDKKAIIWWYPLENLLLNKLKIEFTFRNIKYSFDCRSQDSRIESFNSIRKIIQESTEDEFDTIIRLLFESNNVDVKAYSSSITLNWSQVKKLSELDLVTIGSHTVRHRRLSRLTSDSVIKEFVDSKDKIEKQTGFPVNHLSYPFGTVNDVGEREFLLAKECGFKTATTTRHANIFPAHRSHLMSLPRINIDMGVDTNQLKKMITGLTHFEVNKGKRLIL